MSHKNLCPFKQKLMFWGVAIMPQLTRRAQTRFFRGTQRPQTARGQDGSPLKGVEIKPWDEAEEGA